MTKKKIPLGDYFVSDIYSRSKLVHGLLMPVGVVYDALRTAVTWHSNERQVDTYKGFLVTAIELVDRDRLCGWQKLRLNRQTNLRTGPLFLMTFVRVDGRRTLRERQGFVSTSILNKLGVELPTEGNPIGDKRSVVIAKKVDIDNRGQYWGWSRPRICDIRVKEALPHAVNYVNRLLAKPKTVIRKGPSLAFWRAAV